MSDSASPSTTASVSYSNIILAIILVSYTMIVIDNSVLDRRHLLVAGLALFTLSSLCIGLSTSIGLVVGGIVADLIC
ncbi:MAG: hypothetical protein QM578_03165 [Pantoea sp.]|uniref:hypothetical protein n=1 Tax=Pantoea sp. TaxID=69393 RepID=UPI0039E5B7B3